VTRKLISLALVCGVFLFAACSDSPAAPQGVWPASSVPAFQFLPGGAMAVEGVVGPGALYGLYRPAAWNGVLVLYAHGYVEPGTPLVLPTESPQIAQLRDGLLQLGFAVAMSSFSETGFAVADGAIRTHHLRGLFNASFGPPQHTLLMGHSLGGMVAIKLAETYPGVYAGALPICTFAGGSKRQLEYISEVRAAFDYFFPGVLPGELFAMPDGIDFNQVAVSVVTAMAGDPTAAATFAAVDQLHLPTDPAEIAPATVAALRYQIVGTNDVMARTRRVPVDNATTVYTIGGTPHPGLNAGIERFSSTPDARNYLRRNYEPTGRLSIPVLTVHTSRDPDTPVFHQLDYAARVAAAGRSDQLAQWVIPRFGHCAITEAEHVAALTHLVGWILSGNKPSI
jgi:pimeloyl-ACP methyl ester carboxylesterase